MTAVIGCGDDLRKTKSILADVLAQESRILKHPGPTIAVAELGDSSINIALRPWVRPADYWDVFFAITEAVKLESDAQGITISFP